jgi:sugar lactone lactonase YvrE
VAVLGQANYATPYTFTTLAGHSYGTADGTNSAARINYPSDVAVDTNGIVYVTDSGNSTIRKVTPVGTNWVVTTLAGQAGSYGTADGTASAARFNDPEDLALDSAGNLYVADTGSSTIRKVTLVGTNWVVTTLAGKAGHPGLVNGTGTNAEFYHPMGVALDGAGNLYVADKINSAIRKVTPAGVVTTLATGFNYPRGVALDSAGNLYVADTDNHTIRKLTQVGSSWAVTTIAGLAGNSGTNDGTGSAARFYYPKHVVVDSATNLYVSDTYNFTIRKLTPVGSSWEVTTIAGLAGNSGTNDGTGSAAQFDYPEGVALDSAGNVYVADAYNFTIREVTPVGTNWVVTTLAGLATHSAGSADGAGSAARFNNPWGVAVDSGGNVYVADSGNNTIRRVTPVGTTWVVTTLAGSPVSGGDSDGTGSAAQFSYPESVAVDSAGNVYVANTYDDTILKGFPAGSVPAPILQPPSLSAGQFGFGITGLPGLAVNIESSGDLSQWQFVGTTIIEGGTNYFVSPNPPQGARFYRGRVR